MSLTAAVVFILLAFVTGIYIGELISDLADAETQIDEEIEKTGARLRKLERKYNDLYEKSYQLRLDVGKLQDEKEIKT